MARASSYLIPSSSYLTVGRSPDTIDNREHTKRSLAKGSSIQQAPDQSNVAEKPQATVVTTPQPQHRIPQGWPPFAQSDKNREARPFGIHHQSYQDPESTPEPPGERRGSHWRKGAGGTRSGRSHRKGCTMRSSRTQLRHSLIASSRR